MGILDIQYMSQICKRLTFYLTAWFTFGFITSAQICVAMYFTNNQSLNFTSHAKYHLVAHVIGILILLGGGAAVQGGTGGYVPCPNNVTMDRYCMYTQTGNYMFPYILHYIGGGYACFASWFLDLCHLIQWSFQGAPYTLYCTPQNNSKHSIPFESHWHLGSKALLTLLITITWMLFIDWSTEPSLSQQTHDKNFIGLGSLLGIFFIEVIAVFVLVSLVLWQKRIRALETKEQTLVDINVKETSKDIQ